MQVLDFPARDIVAVPPEGDGMATTKERLDGIDSRLDGIETTLAIKPSKPKSALAQFREHVWQKIKTHKATIIPVVAIAVGALGWFVSGWFKYYLDHRDDAFNAAVDNRIASKLSPLGNRLDGFEVRLARIEGSLNVLITRASITDSVRYVKRGELSLRSRPPKRRSGPCMERLFPELRLLPTSLSRYRM